MEAEETLPMEEAGKAPESKAEEGMEEAKPMEEEAKRPEEKLDERFGEAKPKMEEAKVPEEEEVEAMEEGEGIPGEETGKWGEEAEEAKPKAEAEETPKWEEKEAPKGAEKPTFRKGLEDQSLPKVRDKNRIILNKFTIFLPNKNNFY